MDFKLHFPCSLVLQRISEARKIHEDSNSGTSQLPWHCMSSRLKTLCELAMEVDNDAVVAVTRNSYGLLFSHGYTSVCFPAFDVDYAWYTTNQFNS